MIVSYSQFESDVISDGTQTIEIEKSRGTVFESDVISDGTQTNQLKEKIEECLRVM